MVLLPEDDGSHRPLGVGEAWYRLVGRLAVSIVGQSTGHKLLPIQLGCSIKSGCEIGARLGPVILKSDSDLGLITVDIRNAFNSLRRSLILNGLHALCPQLIRRFEWAYGNPSDLVDGTGELLGVSATGCRQGDPLGPLLFFHETLRRIAELVADTVRDLLLGDIEGLSSVHGVYAYMVLESKFLRR